ncbi:glycosyltransferase [Gillisia sp. JM1]|uniref:glycosyltransferase n=1 Tax=Gillisia sp. JM1 TaxID=1283286 RepID=UPI000428881F|nr:glycosyltransferase [Gillisia sp. JM1]
MVKLFFDIQVSGHHSEYLSHIINFIVDDVQNCDDEFIFVVNTNFFKHFPEITEKSKGIQNIKLFPISPEEQKEEVENQNILIKSFVYYRIMNLYAKRFRVDHAYLLDFNIFQIPLIFYRSNYDLSGILFLQFTRINRDSLKSKLKYYRKYFITKLYLNNPRIKKIFILNDIQSKHFLNNHFTTKKFEVLPDPIPQYEPLNDFNINKFYNIEKTRKIFLHIGSLGNRKGTFELIESLDFLESSIQQKICLLLVGKPESNFAESTIKNLIKTNAESRKTKIVWENNFISNRMMKSLFQQCDAVILPYKNPESSSGILGHAIASNKPVLCTGQGLLKELVESNDLGLLLSEVSPSEIAKSIKSLMVYTPKYSNKNFLSEHTPSIFAKILIN